MRFPRLALTLLLAPIAACGGDDGGGIVPDAEIADGPAAPDAEVPDAEPTAPPDAAPPADLACANDPLPTTASDPIIISGNAYTASTAGQAALQGAIAEAFQVGSATVLASDTSDVDGLYTLTIPNSGMAPIDGYVKGTFSPAGTYKDTYLYPPFPLAADTDQAPLLFITPSTMNLLGFVSGTSQSTSHGFFGVLVIDCAGNPVAGATVSVSPSSSTAGAVTKIVYVGDNNIPDQALTSTGANGLAFVFNVPTGDVVVDAMTDGGSLREHTVTSTADAITTTAVAPGPITVTP